MKNKSIINTCFILYGLGSALASQAADKQFEYIGNFGTSVKNMELVINDRTFNAQFTTLDIGLMATFDKVYVALIHERSIQDDVVSVSDTAGTPGLAFFSRQDNSLTVGYNLWREVNIFGGYRTSTTQNHFNLNNKRLAAKSDGLFAGVSYNYATGDSHAIGVSVAAAQLDGEVTLDEPFANRNPSVTQPDKIIGDALGFSFAINWLGIVSDKTNYIVGFKAQRYEFEDQVIANGIDLSYEDNITGFSLGFSHYF